MSCGAEAGDFFELVAEGVCEGVGGGEGPIDVVPFVVEGGGVGVGENLNFSGDIPLSLSVGDCEGDTSRGSALSSVLMSMIKKVEGCSRGSSFLTWSTPLPDGEGSRKSEALGGPSDGLLLSLFGTAEHNSDIPRTIRICRGCSVEQ
jgi:hypothetical protein